MHLSLQGDAFPQNGPSTCPCSKTQIPCVDPVKLPNTLHCEPSAQECQVEEKFPTWETVARATNRAAPRGGNRTFQRAETFPKVILYLLLGLLFRIWCCLEGGVEKREKATGLGVRIPCFFLLFSYPLFGCVGSYRLWALQCITGDLLHGLCPAGALRLSSYRSWT